jgi:hypothetical protein
MPPTAAQRQALRRPVGALLFRIGVGQQLGGRIGVGGGQWAQLGQRHIWIPERVLMNKPPFKRGSDWRRTDADSDSDSDSCGEPSPKRPRLARAAAPVVPARPGAAAPAGLEGHAREAFTKLAALRRLRPRNSMDAGPERKHF